MKVTILKLIATFLLPLNSFFPTVLIPERNGRSITNTTNTTGSSGEETNPFSLGQSFSRTTSVLAVTFYWHQCMKLFTLINSVINRYVDFSFFCHRYLEYFEYFALYFYKRIFFYNRDCFKGKAICYRDHYMFCFYDNDLYIIVCTKILS